MNVLLGINNRVNFITLEGIVGDECFSLMFKHVRLLHVARPILELYLKCVCILKYNNFCATSWRFCEVVSQRNLLYNVSVVKFYIKQHRLLVSALLTNHHETFFYQVRSSEYYAYVRFSLIHLQYSSYILMK
jgi:hypothetical protein